jgi:hypothetical protein
VLYAGVLAPNAKLRPEVVALAAASAGRAREQSAHVPALGVAVQIVVNVAHYCFWTNLDSS